MKDGGRPHAWLVSQILLGGLDAEVVGGPNLNHLRLGPSQGLSVGDPYPGNCTVEQKKMESNNPTK